MTTARFDPAEDLDAHRPALTIDVFFDLICPWCVIGKRTLGMAVAEFARTYRDVAIDLRWHPLPLLPHLPANGFPFEAFYLQRLGSREAVEARRATVRNAARRVGFDIAFERILRMPNTLAAHRLLEDARQRGTPELHEQLLERMYSAHFREGLDIGDDAVLAALATDCGLVNADELLGRSESTNARLQQWLAQARGFGAASVPTFVFNGSQSVAGALSATVLFAHMRAAHGELSTRHPTDCGSRG
jgi:predicted DsbA family dithiol-disulfide isomerase